MRRRRNFFVVFFSGLISLGLIMLISITVSPNQTVTIWKLQFSIIPLFLFLLCSFLFALGSILSKSALQGILISMVTLAYLLLRLFHLTHWFFAVLLILLFIIVELSLWQKQ